MPTAARRAPEGDPRVRRPLLDPVLAFMQLIWAIDHELERVSKRMELRLGLSIPQRMCLLLLEANPGMLASELADVLHLHRGTVSGILRRLERAGLIARHVDPTDARKATLTITRAGKKIRLHSEGTFEEAVRAALATTADSDQAATVRMLRMLGAELRRAG